MTLTIDLPEQVALRLLALPSGERERFTTDALLDAWEGEEDDSLISSSPLPELTVEDMEAIWRGLAESDAGKGKAGKWPLNLPSGRTAPVWG